MKWFRCISLHSKAILETCTALGKSGAFEVLLVLEEAYGQETVQLDVEQVSNWASVKRDRAERLLPYAQKALDFSRKISRKSPGNLKKSPGNLKKSPENLVDFTPSNPRGSTRDQEQNINITTTEHNRTPEPLVGEGVVDLPESLLADALAMFRGKGLPDEQSRPFLGRAVSQYGKNLVEECLRAAILKDPERPKGYLIEILKAGKQRADAAKQAAQQAVPKSDKDVLVEKIQRLLEAPAIRNRFEKEDIVSRDRLSYDKDTPVTLYKDGQAFYWQEYEAMEVKEWQCVQPTLAI
jgi:hypothetical protein